MPRASGSNMTTAPILLACTLAGDIASGRGLTLFFDNDGTVCPFVTDPKDVKIDPACYAALVRLAHLPNVTVTSLTGREVHEARDLMLTPGHEVRDSSGALLAPAGEKRLFFTIIGSHGVETLAPDLEDGAPGLLTRHAFSVPEAAFISAFQAVARRFQEKSPSLTVEIKHGAVGINAATLETTQDADRAQILADIAAEMTTLLDAPTAPALPDGRRIFALRREGNKELEIRPVTYGKDFGIRNSGALKPERATVFLCDSLGAEGTDTPAAELVNGLGNGMVFMVRNGRNTPPAPNTPCAPSALFDSPADLGCFLTRLAETAEKALHATTAPNQARNMPEPS